MKILLTGFEPFGGESANPSWEAVAHLPDRLGEAELIKCKLPTSYMRAVPCLKEAIDKSHPDIVICIGQNGKSGSIHLETTAVNYADSREPDNDGVILQEQKIAVDGEEGYAVRLPVQRLKEALEREGLEAELSDSAGTYVCNYVLYSLLELCRKDYPDMQGGFVHVPYIPEQLTGKRQGTKSMKLGDIVRALKVIVESLSNEKNKIAL